MLKRGKKTVIKSSAVFEIFLLISFSFAFSFIISGEVVSAGAITNLGTGSNSFSDLIGPAGETVGYGDLQGVFDAQTGQRIAGATTGAAVAGTANPFTEGRFLGLTEFSGTAGHLASGLSWGIVAAGVGLMVGGFLGFDDDQSNALSLASLGGVGVGRIAYRVIVQNSLAANPNLGVTAARSAALGPSLLITAAVGFAIFYFLYKEKEKKLVTFQCLPWEPPVGGEKCEECNKDPLRPCSEYRCKALGQACDILDPGTEEVRCAWVNPKDVTSPTIEPWKDALKPNEELSYIPDTTIRPPNRGVKIIDSRNANNCLEPFTPLEFGIRLNEPSTCKIDFDRNNSFENMQYFFGQSNLHRYNHTERMRLPAPNADLLGGESPLLQNDNTMSLFVRCQDPNGNVNEDSFVFTFCVDPSPDTTPPVIEGTSIIENGAVQFGADSVPIEVYTNEPANCKWSRQSKAYEDMENSMNCNLEADSVNANLQYTCSGDLTGIVNQQENKYYFSCEDLESNRNVQSFPLTLRGSQPLNILEVSPSNETISGATTTVPVTLSVITDDGADEGIAICYFSETGQEGTYIPMFETNSFEHSQSLDLTNGNYDYFVRCVDAGGNSAEVVTDFTVFVDNIAPAVTRAYKDLDALKIVTNEDAECVYSLNDCNYVFDEGLSLLYSNPDVKDSHFAEWKNNVVYHVKCRDDKGNAPGPNECSLIASAVNLI